MPAHLSELPSVVQRGLDFFARARQLQQTEGVPLLHQVSDFRFFQRTLGASPKEFHNYGLWDRTRPIEERVAFMTHAHKRLIEARVSPPSAVAALNDKAAASARLRAAGLRTPRGLGAIDAAADRDSGNIASDLGELCRDAPESGIVLKPNQGMGGYHVQVFSAVTTDRLTRIDGSSLSMMAAARLLQQSSPGSWNAEERLLPHPDLRSVAPLAVCSMRIESLRFPDGAIHLGPATLKMPRGNSGVDNFGSGNVAVAVDLETGGVSGGATVNGDRRLRIHPTTGAAFAALRIPWLAESAAMVRAGAEELRELPLLGWDVALCADGPVILEGNAWSGLDILQIAAETGLVRGEFVHFLESYGLHELLRKREAAAAEWQEKRGETNGKR